MLGIPLSVALSTTYDLWQKGEYNYPAIIYYEWQPEGDALDVGGRRYSWIDDETKAVLQNLGVKGRMKWTGSGGEQTNENRVTIMMQAPTDTGEKVIHFPRKGRLYYIYDGQRWLQYPEDIPVYDYSRMTLYMADDSVTVKTQLSSGATGVHTPFHWPDN